MSSVNVLNMWVISTDGLPFNKAVAGAFTINNSPDQSGHIYRSRVGLGGALVNALDHCLLSKVQS